MKKSSPEKSFRAVHGAVGASARPGRRFPGLAKRRKIARKSILPLDGQPDSQTGKQTKLHRRRKSAVSHPVAGRVAKSTKKTPTPQKSPTRSPEELRRYHSEQINTSPWKCLSEKYDISVGSRLYNLAFGIAMENLEAKKTRARELLARTEPDPEVIQITLMTFVHELERDDLTHQG